MSVRPPLIAIRDHPRAAESIRLWRSRAALAAFAAVLVGSHLNGNTPVECAEHALIAGIAARMLAWAVALTVWRQLLTAEAKRAVENAVRMRRESRDDSGA